MDKFQNFGSKKYLFLLIAVCLVFFVLICKAFDYLPETQQNNMNAISLQNINLPAEQDVSKENTPSENTVSENKKQTNSQEIQLFQPNVITESEIPTETPTAELSNVEENEAAPTLTPDEQAEQTLQSAKKLKTEKQYIKAIEELHKVPAITTNVSIQACAYEEIANIYAIVKHYGTALAFAQKAFNISPSSSREILLARLYYKTGDIDKATRRINNVLQRDFSQDRN